MYRFSIAEAVAVAQELVTMATLVIPELVKKVL
jgi:hypothetical protein